MIFEHMETDYTHINTVMTNGLIHFQNLNCMSHTMQYKIKLKDTSTIKLVNIFKDKKYFGDNIKKLQSFVIDWGDDTVTKIFTEYVNTNVYNVDSNIRLVHHYTVPMDKEIIITIMSESETLVPVPYDETLDSIEVYAMGGEFAPISRNITHTLHPILRENLVELYSLKRYSGRTLLQRYNGTTLNNLFKGFSKLKSIYGDIFLNGCEKVTDAWNTFDGCVALSSIPNSLLDRMPKLKYISHMFNECRSLRSVGRIFANKPIEVAISLFGNCKLLNYVHPDNFRNKTNLNIAHIFHGCTVFERALVLDIFNGSTFMDGGFVYSFSEIQNLETNGDCFNVFLGYTIYSHMFDSVKFKDNDRYETLVHNISVVDAEGYMTNSTKTDYFYERLADDGITLKPNEPGESNIVDMFSNRTREIMSRPFVFDSRVTSLRYQRSLLGHRSLYNDKQIFGRLFDSTQDSGLEMIEATIRYTLKILKPNTTVKFIHAHNKFNPEYTVELGAKAYIKTGVGAEIINAIHAGTDNRTDGVVSVLYQNIGTYNVEVKYTHCAPVCLTYLNNSDRENYSIEAADIELFPTDKPFVGLYGCELWSAKTVTGDFFKLFYDVPNTNVFSWKSTPNVWVDRIFAYFDSSVTTVSNDIFKSIGYLNPITELNELFRYEYKSNTGRDMWTTSTAYTSVNPFRTFNGTIFRFMSEVVKVNTWFNDPENFRMINISGINLNNLFSSLTKIKVINKVLHACELIITSDSNKILWTNNNAVEEIVSYIGRVNYLATDLLMKPKLRKVNRFHLLHMVNGADNLDFSNCFMDFANSTNDIDLTEMFYDEAFEIPDGFIRNVKGKLKFNNCFKGSYRFDINNDSSLFTNVPNKETGNITAIEFASISEPLVMEFNNYTTETGTIGLVLKDKDGANHKVVARLYSKESGRYKVIFTKHANITDTDLIPSMSLLSGTTGVKLELFCNTANIYLNNLSIMNVKNLSGVYSRTQWIDKVRMQDAYPGLVPSNIICTEAGGPWRNITPTDGVINFNEMFTGITNKELIDYRILKTNSPAKTTYNLTGTFKNGSIADFDVRMFEFIGDMLIDGTSMFYYNADENFNFVNLDSGPYIFMELLFTKFKTVYEMFRYAALPRTLFNHAVYFGCDRNGDMLPDDKFIDLNMYCFLFKWNQPTETSNNLTEEFLPQWNKNSTYKVNNLRDFVVLTNYKYNPEGVYTILPKSTRTYSSWGMFNVVTGIKHSVLDNIELGTSTLINAPWNGPVSISKDYEFINSNVTSSEITFNSFLSRRLESTDNDYKLLIQPFNNSFETLNISLDHSSFSGLDTYAPENILFRNVGLVTGTSGVNRLTYPNFIEYQNIHLTGNQVTFIREELDPNHRFSTYLTVHIKYSDTYEEAKWFIVDKNADSYTIDLEPSKITNNIVSIKIQSTQCFFLTKTNVDYVERLDGTYRKDLQPRDSEFFNFDVEYYYFIERFGADLWKDVKIKQGEKFTFGYNAPSMSKLKHIDGSPFRTQKHLTSTPRLFYNCQSYTPLDTVLIGLENVTSSWLLFPSCKINRITTELIKPLVNTTDIGDSFNNCGVIDFISQDLLKYNTKNLYVNNLFLGNEFSSTVVLTPTFWESISNATYRFRSMFGNVKGIGKNRRERQFISDNSFTFTDSTLAENMFIGTELLDVRTSWVKSGKLLDANSVNMFSTCSTYEEQSAFEAVYGNQTGVTFKCHEPMIYKSSTANLAGTFKFIDNTECPNPAEEYVKVVVDSGTFYKSLTEMQETGITLATSKVEIYSDYAIAFDCPNVERLEGRYPAKNGEVGNGIYFKIGYKYPNLTYIDPHLFDKLVNQTDMSGVFSNLSDISLIQGTLLAPMTKLMYVNSMYAGAKGTISALLDITKYIGPSNKITRYFNLFDSVDIKQIGTGAIKINNTVNVNMNNMFNGCGSYVDRSPFVGTIDATVEGMFSSCKSLYSEAELITFTKTGTSMINTLNYFAPTLNITTANTEVQLLCADSSVSPSTTIDICIDWGDNTSNVVLSVPVSSLSNYRKVFANTGDKIVRLWSSLHAISIKSTADSSTTASSIIKHLGGYIGRYVDRSTEGYINKYFPNATTVSSEFIRDIDPAIPVTWIGRNSKIVTMPALFLKRNQPGDTSSRSFVFEDMLELSSINRDFFKEASGTTLNALSLYALFYNTPKLSLSDAEFEKLFEPITRISDNPTWTHLFRNSGIIINQAKFRTLVNKFQATEIILSTAMSNSYVDEPRQIFDVLNGSNKKIVSLSACFESSNINSNQDYILNKNLFKEGTTSLTDMFKNAIINGSSVNGTSRLNSLIIDGTKTGVTLNIAGSLTGIKSVYTESEIFGGNTTTGASGLITDPRISMTMKVSAGTLNLVPFQNSSYNSKLLIKKNGTVHSLNPYANKSLTVAENDIIEIVTFDNVKDVYMTVDTVGSTAKVKELGGILNIGPASISEGKFRRTIAECFGTSVTTISDTFFTQFNTITSAANLCKGITGLRSIPNQILSPMVKVTDWSSMFEGCTSLNFTDNNSEMFTIANKGVTFDYMFKNSGVTYVPPRFFKGCLELNKTFIGVFMLCNLTAVPQDIGEF